MNGYHNDAKAPSKYGTVFFMNWAEINTTVEVSEMRYCKDDEAYYLYCHAEKISDLAKSKEKDWKYTPQLMCFTFPRKPTVHKKGEDAIHYLAEKLMCYALEQLDETKTYKGTFSLSNAGFVKTIVDGVDMQGKPCPDAVRRELASSMVSFEETTPDKISADDVKPIAKPAWGGGSKMQSEAEKLADRVAFVVNQISQAGYEVKTLKDVALLEVNDPALVGVMDWVYKILG